jgi:hypothetical protein
MSFLLLLFLPIAFVFGNDICVDTGGGEFSCSDDVLATRCVHGVLLERPNCLLAAACSK